MDFNSKYKSSKIEEILDSVGGKQDAITDLEEIRQGAAKGATAIQDISGKADDTSVVHKTGNETISGAKTFNNGVNFLGNGDSNAVTLSTNTRINVNGTNQTVLGFGSGTFYINHANYSLLLRGKDTRPKYNNVTLALSSDVDGKQDKVSGKGLSTEDFTSALKTKLEGLSNYDDTELSEALSTLRGDFDKLVSGDTTTAIKTFNEVIAFLDGIQDSQDLSSIIASIEQQIAGKMDKVTLATVATSGSYNDLSNKPTIPTTVTESTVSGWGFTKNTGTLTGVAINGTTINASNGVVYIPNASMGSYGTTKLNSSTNSTSTSEAATPSAVKAAYDLANGKQDQLVSGTSIKTINNQSLLGSGNITISGGGAVPTKLSQLENDTNFVALQGEELPYVETAGLYDPISSVLYSLPGGEWTGAEDKKLAGVVNVGGFNLVECQGITGSSGDMIVLPREADGYEDDILVTRSYLKTINGESIVGSGNIEISGGGGSPSGGGAYAEVNHGTSDTTFTLTPNTFHVWDEVQGLDLNFGDPIEGIVNEYIFQFSSPYGKATTLWIPGGILWPASGDLIIEEGKTYIISIVNKFGVFAEYPLPLSGTDPA